MLITTKGRLFQFYSWVARPTTVYSLRAILKTLPDSDLLVLMTNTDSKQALTVAWAEYGRRHADVNIEFEMQERFLEIRATELILGHGAQLVC